MQKLCVLMVLVAAPAMAADRDGKLREMCEDRPGLGTPACTVDKGHLQVEVGVGDWQLDKQPDQRTDTIAVGDIAMRLGVGNSTELRVDWTPYTHIRTRDRTSGAIDRVKGIGDVTVGVKQNLANPDGNGFSLALLPYATLPSAKKNVGAGDWGGGVLIPVTYQLSDKVLLEATPEFDGAVNASGHGRHFAYGSVIGIQYKLGKDVSVSAEMQAMRDRDPDPSERSTQELAALSVAYQASDNLQFDAGAIAGLNHKSPDVELSFGVSRRF